MLEIFVTTKVLPVRIFHPFLNYRFVTLVKCMFEIMKSYHQAGRYAWSSNTIRVECTEFIVET